MSPKTGGTGARLPAAPWPAPASHRNAEHGRPHGICRRRLSDRLRAAGNAAAAQILAEMLRADAEARTAGGPDQQYDDPTLEYLARTPGLPTDVVRGLIVLAQLARRARHRDYRVSVIGAPEPRNLTPGSAACLAPGAESLAWWAGGAATAVIPLVTKNDTTASAKARTSPIRAARRIPTGAGFTAASSRESGTAPACVPPRRVRHQDDHVRGAVGQGFSEVITTSPVPST